MLHFKPCIFQLSAMAGLSPGQVSGCRNPGSKGLVDMKTGAEVYTRKSCQGGSGSQGWKDEPRTKWPFGVKECFLLFLLGKTCGRAHLIRGVETKEGKTVPGSPVVHFACLCVFLFMTLLGTVTFSVFKFLPWAPTGVLTTWLLCGFEGFCSLIRSTLYLMVIYPAQVQVVRQVVAWGQGRQRSPEALCS